jgi:hypothetical protein
MNGSRRRSIRQGTAIRSALCIFCLLLPALALSDKPRFEDTFSFALGGMAHEADATFSSTKDGEPLDKLTLKDLGIDDDTTVVWMDFDWQFRERWKFNLSYTSFDANGFKSQSVGGNYDDLEWDAGASLTSGIGVNLFIADVNWDFLQTDNAHVGVGLGLHVAELEFDIFAEVTGNIGGSGGSMVIGTEEDDFTAPLPNVVLTGGMMIGQNVYLSATAGYFTLEYDRYDGEVVSLRAAAEWRPRKHFGVGVGYQHVDIHVDVDKSRKKEQYDLQLYGPVLFVSVGF